jgi:hypothetical protein
MVPQCYSAQVSYVLSLGKLLGNFPIKLSLDSLYIRARKATSTVSYTDWRCRT